MTTSPRARLIYSASESDANMLWATQFFAPAPFIFDISRTVVRGKAWERLKAAYRCVEEGQEMGFRRIRDGVDAFGIHTEILAHFETNGFSTGVLDGRTQGFFHGTGHGLGRDIHEAPGINSRNHTILKTGHVVTVEPGFTILEWPECGWKMLSWLQRLSAKIWFESLRFMKSGMLGNMLSHLSRGSY